MERFENLSEAIDRFQECRGTISEYSDDSARTTLGISVSGAEFDILHVRQDKNCLVQDFTQMETPLSSNQFLQDLQTIADTVGFDNTRVHREMTPEEVKAFVKERFAYQLRMD